MSKLRQVIDALTLALNVSGTVGIFMLMLLINADVIGRSFFDRPISGVPEIVSLSIVAIVFLQIAQAYRKRRLTRADALLNWVRGRSARTAEGLELLFAIASLALIGVLFHASWPLFTKAFERGTYVGTVGDFIAPVWPVKLVLLIGCAVLMLQIVLRILEHLTNLIAGRRSDSSDAVPHDPI